MTAKLAQSTDPTRRARKRSKRLQAWARRSRVDSTRMPSRPPWTATPRAIAWSTAPLSLQQGDRLREHPLGRDEPSTPSLQTLQERARPGVILDRACIARPPRPRCRRRDGPDRHSSRLPRASRGAIQVVVCIDREHRVADRVVEGVSEQQLLDGVDGRVHVAGNERGIRRGPRARGCPATAAEPAPTPPHAGGDRAE